MKGSARRRRPVAADLVRPAGRRTGDGGGAGGPADRTGTLVQPRRPLVLPDGPPRCRLCMWDRQPHAAPSQTAGWHVRAGRLADRRRRRRRRRPRPRRSPRPPSRHIWNTTGERRQHMAQLCKQTHSAIKVTPKYSGARQSRASYGVSVDTHLLGLRIGRTVPTRRTRPSGGCSGTTRSRSPCRSASLAGLACRAACDDGPRRASRTSPANPGRQAERWDTGFATCFGGHWSLSSEKSALSPRVVVRTDCPTCRGPRAASARPVRSPPRRLLTDQLFRAENHLTGRGSGGRPARGRPLADTRAAPPRAGRHRLSAARATLAEVSAGGPSDGGHRPPAAVALPHRPHAPRWARPLRAT